MFAGIIVCKKSLNCFWDIIIAIQKFTTALRTTMTMNDRTANELNDRPSDRNSGIRFWENLMAIAYPIRRLNLTLRW